jgi:hypothetical protein
MTLKIGLVLTRFKKVSTSTKYSKLKATMWITRLFSVVFNNNGLGTFGTFI